MEINYHNFLLDRAFELYNEYKIYEGCETLIDSVTWKCNQDKLRLMLTTFVMNKPVIVDSFCKCMNFMYFFFPAGYGNKIKSQYPKSNIKMVIIFSDQKLFFFHQYVPF